MARDYYYAALRPAVSSINGLLAYTVVLLLTIQGAWSQRVRVEEELEAFPTESVNLRCEFIDGGAKTKLTQVSWIWEPVEGQRDNIAVFHPIYGQSFPDSPFKERVRFLQGDLVHPSIQISELKMSDAGRYTCEYATYPSGNEQGTTNLVMLAKPRNTAQVVTVQVGGTKAVVVAQCEAADGKPAATIGWASSGGEGAHTTSSKAGADGTVTVRSEYRLVPTAADHGREVTCTVSQRTQDRADSFPIRLSIEYPPTVSIEGYDNNWYVGRSDAVLTCQVDANPQASNITWRAVSGPMPDSVVVEGNRLTVRKVDPAVNTTFVCEVQNRLGVSRDQVTTSITEKPKPKERTAGPATGAIIGGIIGALVLIGVIIAIVLFVRKRQEDSDGPPKHKPPPPVKSGGSTEMLTKKAEPPPEATPLSEGEVYYETSGGEPITNLDDEATLGSGALNGGAPPGLDDTASYHNDHDLHDDDQPLNQPPGANIARGESFVSAAMYV